LVERTGTAIGADDAQEQLGRREVRRGFASLAWAAGRRDPGHFHPGGARAVAGARVAEGRDRHAGAGDGRGWRRHRGARQGRLDRPRGAQQVARATGADPGPGHRTRRPVRATQAGPGRPGGTRGAIMTRVGAAMAAKVLVLLSLAACSPDEAPPATETLHPAPTTLSVAATGELKSSKATTLLVPGSQWAERRLEWMVDEGSTVAKDELVARFTADSGEAELAQA